jgi:hypothetical protein
MEQNVSFWGEGYEMDEPLIRPKTRYPCIAQNLSTLETGPSQTPDSFTIQNIFQTFFFLSEETTLLPKNWFIPKQFFILIQKFFKEFLGWNSRKPRNILQPPSPLASWLRLSMPIAHVWLIPVLTPQPLVHVRDVGTHLIWKERHCKAQLYYQPIHPIIPPFVRWPQCNWRVLALIQVPFLEIPPRKTLKYTVWP